LCGGRTGRKNGGLRRGNIHYDDEYKKKKMKRGVCKDVRLSENSEKRK